MAIFVVRVESGDGLLAGYAGEPVRVSEPGVARGFVRPALFLRVCVCDRDCEGHYKNPRWALDSVGCEGERTGES